MDPKANKLRVQQKHDMLGVSFRTALVSTGASQVAAKVIQLTRVTPKSTTCLNRVSTGGEADGEPPELPWFEVNCLSDMNMDLVDGYSYHEVDEQGAEEG